MSATIRRATLNDTMFVALRNIKTKDILNINTIHDLNIGIVENTANVVVTGRTECRGVLDLKDGALGALKLPGGVLSIIAGDNVTVTYNDNGTVTIASSGGGGGATSYSFNESVAAPTFPNLFTDLANTPSPQSSLMLFMNGQLLTAGEGLDYQLSVKRVTFDSNISGLNSSKYFATYSY